MNFSMHILEINICYCTKIQNHSIREELQYIFNSFLRQLPNKSAVLFRMPVVAGIQIVSRRRVFEQVILQDAGCRMQVAAVLRIVAQGRVVNELIIPTHIREINISVFF